MPQNALLSARTMDDSKSQANQTTSQPKAFNVDDLLASGMDEADLSEP